MVCMFQHNLCVWKKSKGVKCVQIIVALNMLEKDLFGIISVSEHPVWVYMVTGINARCT